MPSLHLGNVLIVRPWPSQSVSERDVEGLKQRSSGEVEVQLAA